MTEKEEEKLWAQAYLTEFQAFRSRNIEIISARKAAAKFADDFIKEVKAKFKKKEK